MSIPVSQPRRSLKAFGLADTMTNKVLKHNRVTEIATENRLPIVGLVQSVRHSTIVGRGPLLMFCSSVQAGAFLPQQFRVFHKAGQMFRDLSRRTQAGLHSCSVVFGSSTAGGAYLPGLSDYTIFVRKQAQVFLGGPPLVKMATGEVVDAETLGGGDMHASVTGLADQLAVDEYQDFGPSRLLELTQDQIRCYSQSSRVGQVPGTSKNSC